MRITAGGHVLEAELIEGAEPALVFLHEGLGSIRLWRDFPARVAKATGRKALVYDRYGYGQSDVLEEEKVDVKFMHRGAQELAEVLKAFRIKKPVLVGHSDGASIALIYSGLNEVERLVVLAPHVFIEKFNLESIRRIRATFETTDLPQRFAKYHTDPRKTFYLWNDAWLDPAFEKWNIEEYLPGITCPVLAIQGENDEYGTMAQLEAIKRQVKGPCELLKLEDCGHSPHRDQPERVLSSVVSFVNAIDSANP
ncbi:MAG TPA: alpha/beta hydrolase [Burkholderiales bacterium]|jgi:pimeloyl-ACP methyl ester carboxylesterase|nr:alpha/beta hydrolase [Burkholderiales bacterium]